MVTTKQKPWVDSWSSKKKKQTGNSIQLWNPPIYKGRRNNGDTEKKTGTSEKTVLVSPYIAVITLPISVLDLPVKNYRPVG